MLTLILVLTCVVGAALQRITGLGFALVVSPVSVLLLGPIQGVVVVNLCAVAVAAALAVRSFTRIQWRRCAVLIAAAPIGILPGAWIVHLASPALLDVLVGGLLITAISVTAFIRPHPVRPRHRAGALGLAGAASGALSVTAGVGGPPMAIYGMATGWERASFAATLQPLFMTIGLMSLTAKWNATSTVVLDDGWVVVALIAGCTSGVLLGQALEQHVSAVLGYRLLAGLALGGGAAVVIRGVGTLLA